MIRKIDKHKNILIILLNNNGIMCLHIGKLDAACALLSQASAILAKLVRSHGSSVQLLLQYRTRCMPDPV